MTMFLDGRVVLHQGDAAEILRSLERNSIDSVVTDPPYGLGFMGKQWDAAKNIAFDVELWRLVLHVLKPGAHLLAFSGTRTYHRMACAIEDAGFEIRDMTAWLYGSGFPKNHDIALQFEKRICRAEKIDGVTRWFYLSDDAELDRDNFRDADAQEWTGYGTALKPALEPICLAQKPLSEKSFAANVLKWGTGALNIDGCRIEAGTEKIGDGSKNLASWRRAEGRADMPTRPDAARPEGLGRWAANVIHDGSDEVIAAFPEAPGQGGSVSGSAPSSLIANVYGQRTRVESKSPRNDSGSAARFFYSAKANDDDRLGSKHPTVKPVDLMQYLCRLVTPAGGTVLDPFAGTGTTGEAAYREKFRAVLIERETEYQDDIARRMALCVASRSERRRAVAVTKPLSAAPLFDG